MEGGGNIDARDVDDVEREVVAEMVKESAVAAEEVRSAKLAKLTERLDKAMNANKTALVRELRREIEDAMAMMDKDAELQVDESQEIDDIAAGHLNPFEEKRGNVTKVARSRKAGGTSKEIEWVEIQGGLRIPADLYDRLFDYQKTSLRWLWELHGQCAGGLIGDEMGLGKTIQVVAFMTALALSKKFEPGTGILILAPATVLRQWYREFETWSGKYRCFSVRILHGSDDGAAEYMKHEMAVRRFVKKVLKGKSRGEDSDSDSDSDEERTIRPVGVVITTYEQFRRHQEVLTCCEWEYAVLDEGHKIRNPEAAVTQACKGIGTPRRLLLSGSPMQNNLRELWSLFDFVFPGKLGDLDTFETQFGVPISIGGYASASASQVHTAYQCAVALKTLIAPYMLRRMKKDVALQLPKKSEQILFCKLAKGHQTDMYNEFIDSRYVREVIGGKGNVLAALGILRKICNHPELAKATISNPTDEEDEDEEGVDMLNEISSTDGLVEKSGKMIVLDEILRTWAKEGHRVLLFSQSVKMLTLLENYLIQTGLTYRRMDGTTATGQRMGLIDEFNGDESIFIFLLTTRVGGLGVNLTGANRVVIYDPDWNPANDLQARERAWRVGQKKAVVVYRLVTSGTVEEKIYHRQIYKQFLGQKVLSDPKQRRFFKPKRMGDLFTYAESNERQGTETGEIFAGTGAVEVRQEAAETPGDDEQSKGTSAGDEDVLRSLLGKRHDLASAGNGALHSAIDHDKVLCSTQSGMDVKLIEYEAGRVAKSALEELKRSRERLEAEQSASLQSSWKKTKLGSVKTTSSSALLSKLRSRDTGALEAADPATGLAQRLSDFIAERGGTVATDDLLSHFDRDLGGGPNAVAIFKAVLKKVARLDKPEGRSGPRVWQLLPFVDGHADAPH